MIPPSDLYYFLLFMNNSEYNSAVCYRFSFSLFYKYKPSILIFLQITKQKMTGEFIFFLPNFSSTKDTLFGKLRSLFRKLLLLPLADF